MGGEKTKMDEKRQKLLVRSLRETGKLANEVGEQFWHEEEPVREERAIW